ncbi:MAG: ABC transporter substrate-binding protein [Rhodospirillales bacterium]|mgnify:CR=1 FL=1|jgi:branched-chain amino acid transport system substrate-binding protein|nr:ABC transporter substrate-binding protein [Rhodospirillales bacterium]MDP6642763.1 ABC transporter substrate-binding protein [Rhodospirillales bacterium]MDP6841505.1 ABC transporter substrate-binding protein [Rhodospirillales bacterium]
MTKQKDQKLPIIGKTGKLSRRRFVKTAGATAGLAAAASHLPMPALAQSRTIRIGYVSPQTGPLAPFGESDNFNVNNFRQAVRNGLKLGGKTYKIEVTVKDSQSNPNRAAEVAKELIVDTKVDLMMVANTPETTNPVATQSEIEEVPCISTNCPWQPWFIGQQGNPGDPKTWKPFNWAFHYFWGLEDVIAVFTNMWSQLDTNKVVGGAFPNDADGNAWGDAKVGLPPALAAKGYKLIDPGRYQNLTDDFSAQITAFKKGGAEIMTGVMLPPDFTTFWTQARQQGFRPKAASIGKAILFPVSVQALGAAGHNLSSEVWWSPAHPFKSSLTGQSSADLSKAYTAATGKQWTQPIGFVHSLFEMAVDVLKRTADVGSNESIRDAIASSNIDTIVGHVQWNGKGLPPFAAKNISKTPLVGGQWRHQGGNKYDLVITDNRTAPEIPVTADMQAIS